MAREGTIFKQLRQLSGESSHHWPSFRILELQDQCFAKCDAKTSVLQNVTHVQHVSESSNDAFETTEYWDQLQIY